MKMFKCLDCGGIFEDGEQGRYEEGNPPYQEVYCCPYCKSSDYDEILPCKLCGTYEHEISDDYCEDCVNEVRKSFMAMLETFEDEEKELIKYLGLVGEDIL